MPYRSPWYMTSAEVIEAALEVMERRAKSQSLPITRQMVVSSLRDSYPFGQRAMWPYKQWLRARKDTLRRRYPKLFNSDVRSCGEGTLYEPAQNHP